MISSIDQINKMAKASYEIFYEPIWRHIVRTWSRMLLQKSSGGVSSTKLRIHSSCSQWEFDYPVRVSYGFSCGTEIWNWFTTPIQGRSNKTTWGGSVRLNRYHNEINLQLCYAMNFLSIISYIFYISAITIIHLSLLRKKNFFSKEFYSEPLIYCRITCNNRHTFLTRPPVIAAFGNSIATQIVYGFVLSADNRGRINPVSSREPCSTVTDEWNPGDGDPGWSTLFCVNPVLHAAFANPLAITLMHPLFSSFPRPLDYPSVLSPRNSSRSHLHREVCISTQFTAPLT